MVGGKVHHRVGLLKSVQQLLAVVNIPDYHFESAGKKLKAGGQVVIDENVKTSPPQHPRRLTADITRPANHKNFHVISASRLRFSAWIT